MFYKDLQRSKDFKNVPVFQNFIVFEKEKFLEWSTKLQKFTECSRKKLLDCSRSFPNLSKCLPNFQPFFINIQGFLQYSKKFQIFQNEIFFKAPELLKFSNCQ